MRLASRCSATQERKQNDANNTQRVCLVRSYVCCADICCAFYILYVHGLRMRVLRVEGNENLVDTSALEQD
jgi:hypothetical protein